MGLDKAYTFGYQATVTITRPDNTTAYAAGDVIGVADAETPANAGSAILHMADIAPQGGGAIMITSVDLMISAAAVPSGMAGFRLHLYSASPTAILDNAAFDLAAGDRATYLGYVDLATPVDRVSTLQVQADQINKHLLATSASLWGILETVGGYTPSASTAKKIRVHTVRV